MTKYTMIKNMSIDEFAEWLDKYMDFDNAPWWHFWDSSYCSKCKSEITYDSETDDNSEFAWCELNSKCKFFKEMDSIPGNKDIIKMWLESESK